MTTFVGHCAAGTDRNSGNIPGPVPEQGSGDNSGPADFPVDSGQADFIFGRFGKFLHASGPVLYSVGPHLSI